MILILTSPDDPSADIVEGKLRSRGADVLRFDDAQLPAGARLTASFVPGSGLRRTLEVDGRRIDLRTIRAAWDHRPGPPVPHLEVTRTSARGFATHENQRFADDLWHHLGCVWMPAPKAVVLRGQHKGSQLRLAGRLGFELPPTLVTNDPREALEFYRRHGRIVGKAFWMGHEVPDGDPDEPTAFQCFTQVVSNRSLGYLSSVRHAPVIFQAYVPKRLELRVTVVGDRVFAAEIDSQVNHRTMHDWRHPDLARTPYRVHALPEAEAARCRALLEALGLCFGTIDLVLTPDGRYVFLEINPSGQWRWVETLTGLRISDAICDLLAAPGERRGRGNHPHPPSGHLLPPVGEGESRCIPDTEVA